MRYIAGLLITTLAAISLTSWASEPCSVSPPAEPFCKLLAQPKDRDNSTVIVEGEYFREPHGTSLASWDCPSAPLVNLEFASDFHQKDKITKTLRSLTDKWKPAKVILKGVFHVAKAGESFGRRGAGYEIEITQVLCVELAPDKRPTSGATQPVIDPKTGDLHFSIPVAPRANAKR